MPRRAGYGGQVAACRHRPLYPGRRAAAGEAGAGRWRDTQAAGEGGTRNIAIT